MQTSGDVVSASGSSVGCLPAFSQTSLQLLPSHSSLSLVFNLRVVVPAHPTQVTYEMITALNSQGNGLLASAV